MKRYILYIVVLLAMLAVPAQRNDVGRLLPVEVIAVYQDVGGVRIETDTGNVGTGRDLESAYRNLKGTAAGEIFLDTADYLILYGEAKQLSEKLREYLKLGIRVCAGEGEIDLVEASEYLSVHIPNMRLKDENIASRLAVLTRKETGYCLS